MTDTAPPEPAAQPAQPAQPAPAGPPDATADVAAMLARSGLPAHPHEIAYLAAEYPYLKAGIDLLYAVEEARHADPALRFQAGARLAPWSG